MHELARARVRFGYRRIHVILRREGWAVGRNQAYRIYCQEALPLRSKLPMRRKMIVTRRERFRTSPTERGLEHGPLGVPSRRPDRIEPAWEADRQQLRGELQRGELYER